MFCVTPTIAEHMFLLHRWHFFVTEALPWLYFLVDIWIGFNNEYYQQRKKRIYYFDVFHFNLFFLSFFFPHFLISLSFFCIFSFSPLYGFSLSLFRLHLIGNAWLYSVAFFSVLPLFSNVIARSLFLWFFRSLSISPRLHQYPILAVLPWAPFHCKTITHCTSYNVKLLTNMLLMWTIWNVKYEYKCEKPNKMENECENYMDFFLDIFFSFTRSFSLLLLD